MTLIPIVVRRPKLHTGKYWGGLLNPARGFYVFRTEKATNPMPMLVKEQEKRLGHAGT